jgi:hypothetical protein
MTKEVIKGEKGMILQGIKFVKGEKKNCKKFEVYQSAYDGSPVLSYFDYTIFNNLPNDKTQQQIKPANLWNYIKFRWRVAKYKRIWGIK